ncbi:hypothetical protein QLQ85_15850 [Halomonas sp. M4R5S39]|uniref:hypothetical protein n=1 Tax=Halomonas kalidii TaxID=3043293 RepID=UPI0024A7AF6D|nr:hypothetical protein [Halomonas kalidii]MDI5986267.1 hypothetical protein [Halomonas kalidii]
MLRFLAVMVLLPILAIGCTTTQPEKNTAAEFERECREAGNAMGSWALRHCTLRRSAMYALPYLSSQAASVMVTIQQDWRGCNRSAIAYRLPFEISDYRDRDAVTDEWIALLGMLDSRDNEVARNWPSVLDGLYDTALPKLIEVHGVEQGWEEFSRRMDMFIGTLEQAERQTRIEKCHQQAVEAYGDSAPLFLN